MLSKCNWLHSGAPLVIRIRAAVRNTRAGTLVTIPCHWIFIILISSFMANFSARTSHRSPKMVGLMLLVDHPNLARASWFEPFGLFQIFPSVEFGSSGIALTSSYLYSSGGLSIKPSFSAIPDAVDKWSSSVTFYGENMHLSNVFSRKSRFSIAPTAICFSPLPLVLTLPCASRNGCNNNCRSCSGFTSSEDSTDWAISFALK